MRQAALDAQIVVLCGAADILAEVNAPGPLLRVDPAQPERLRAILRALASPPALFFAPQDDKAPKGKVDRERVEGVLADLPPPLYVGSAAVCDEVLADHDLKRLLYAYGVRVSRQAPANTTTAALRILGKLNLPVELLPAVEPQTDVEEVIAKEAAARLLCSTQAEVKRQATLLLSHSAHVLLREVSAPAPKLRLQAGVERGLGSILRLTTMTAKDTWMEAALLPLQAAEAQKLAEGVLGPLLDRDETACDAKELSELLTSLSACLSEQALTLDLVVLLKKEPAVLHAAGVLKRQAARATSSRSSS